MSLDLLQLVLQLLDPPSYEAAVRLYLCLTWASRANTTTQAFEVGPLTGQTRKQVLVLGQFYLKPALPCLGPSGEDVQDKGAPVYDLCIEDTLQVALLSRRELIVKDGHLVAKVGF